MKKYSVIFNPVAEKAFLKLDKPVQQRIQKYILRNLEGCENPRKYGSALEGDLRTFWRYRIGDYRLVAEIKDDEIIILVVGIDKRNDIYKKKSRQKLT